MFQPLILQWTHFRSNCGTDVPGRQDHAHCKKHCTMGYWDVSLLAFGKIHAGAEHLSERQRILGLMDQPMKAFKMRR